MPRLKRISLMVLVLFGPGFLIWFMAKTVRNEFKKLPYIGEHTYIKNDKGEIVDTVYYTVPKFELERLDGKKITNQSINNQFVVLSTIQNTCPDTCGIFLFHFVELFYKKLVKNQDNYSNVKIISILTDLDGNPVYNTTPKFLDELAEIKNEVKNIDGYSDDIWWIVKGDPKPLFNFKFKNTYFYDNPSTPDNYEVGSKAFINSLVLIDRKGHVRGFTGSRRDSDIRNFFDLLKILKKVEFDETHKR
ncbi:MAG TPA: hypothetical protein EYG85_13045 [Crocinitomix sp.]|nr:hypothetical protein [Crocinitomix sp.]